MYKVSRTHWPGSGGPEEVRLRDGICAAQGLVYFPLWIPVLPAGLSQVLALIRLGSARGEEGNLGFRSYAEGEEEARGETRDRAGVRHAQLGTAGDLRSNAQEAATAAEARGVGGRK